MREMVLPQSFTSSPNQPTLLTWVRSQLLFLLALLGLTAMSEQDQSDILQKHTMFWSTIHHTFVCLTCRTTVSFFPKPVDPAVGQDCLDEHSRLGSQYLTPVRAHADGQCERLKKTGPRFKNAWIWVLFMLKKAPFRRDPPTFIGAGGDLPVPNRWLVAGTQCPRCLLAWPGNTKARVHSRSYCNKAYVSAASKTARKSRQDLATECPDPSDFRRGFLHPDGNSYVLFTIPTNVVPSGAGPSPVLPTAQLDRLVVSAEDDGVSIPTPPQKWAIQFNYHQLQQELHDDQPNGARLRLSLSQLRLANFAPGRWRNQGGLLEDYEPRHGLRETCVEFVRRTCAELQAIHSTGLARYVIYGTW